MTYYFKCAEPRKKQRNDRTDIYELRFQAGRTKIDMEVPAEGTIDELESEFNYIINQLRQSEDH